MALTDEHQAIWEKLATQAKQPFSVRIKHTPEDVSLEAPGVYAVWEGDKLLYIGVATLTRPDGSTKKRLWGLKDRLESHRRAQISGSSLALGLWFCRIAPSLTAQEHTAISERTLNPSYRTEEFIKKLSYTCIVVRNAGVVEAALCRDIKPEINNFQEFVRLDRQKRRKEGLEGPHSPESN